MAITLATATRNAMCNAVVDLLDVGGAGNLQIGTTAFATILSVITLPNPAFGSASAGAASLSSAVSDTAADNTGTAAVYRFRQNSNQVVWSGPVAATDTGADITLDDVARHAALNAITTLIGATGTIQFATSNAFTTILATLNLGNPAFGAAAAGSIAMTGNPTGSAAVAGTCTAFRIRDSSTGTVLDGTVGTSGSDINFDNNIFGVGSTITLTGASYVISMATTAASANGVLVFAGGLAFTAGETIQLASASFNQPA